MQPHFRIDNRTRAQRQKDFGHKRRLAFKLDRSRVVQMGFKAPPPIVANCSGVITFLSHSLWSATTRSPPYFSGMTAFGKKSKSFLGVEWKCIWKQNGKIQTDGKCWIWFGTDVLSVTNWRDSNLASFC